MNGKEWVEAVRREVKSRRKAKYLLEGKRVEKEGKLCLKGSELSFTWKETDWEREEWYTRESVSKADRTRS